MFAGDGEVPQLLQLRVLPPELLPPVLLPTQHASQRAAYEIRTKSKFNTLVTN